MPRFFVGTDQISDKDIVITGTDVNHIRNVLRMTPGEEVTVSDGQGMDYFCRIAELTKEEVRLDIVDSWHSFVELPAKIYLFQGLIFDRHANLKYKYGNRKFWCRGLLC